MNSGQIVDSSIVAVPRPRNSRRDHDTLKSGGVPEDWQDNPSKRRQKDTDARWTKKRNQSYYGYKNHVSVDGDTQLIERWSVTAASTHDSQVFEQLLAESPEGDGQVWADSAYQSAAMKHRLRRRGYKPRLNYKATRARPLSVRQKQLNKAYSKGRARVEPVFGAMETQMPQRHMRGIGASRAHTWIGLRNLCDNMKRLNSLQPSLTAR